MSDSHPDAFKSYVRKCGIIFGAVACVTLVMVGTSYAPIHNRALAIGLVLAAAAVNAVLVASYLMHLISEKKMIYTVLAFTAIFFVGLMGLTIWATHDVPAVLGR
jgi:heme/copper-type cytochrome/quinol oxidase subunit 4